MTVLRIEVKQTDIVAGVANNGRFCPVARAIRRVLRREGRPTRGLWAGNWRFVLAGQSTAWPEETVAWIKRFDRSQPVLPFAFDLEIAGSF